MKSLSSFQLQGILTETGSSVAISNDILTDTAASFTDETILLTSDDNSIKELMVASASGGTLTISQRGLDQSTTKTTDTDLQHEFRSGTVGRVTASASDLVDLDGDNTISGENTFTSDTTFEEAIITEKGVASTIYASTAARDAALGGDGAATKAYTSIQAGGTFYNYNTITAQWESIDTGTAVPNMSETVAGKGELATQTENDDGTETGGTTAPLVTNPLRIGRSIQKQAYTYDEDTGAANVYVITLSPVPLAYVEGMRISVKIGAGNSSTGASTINVNSLGAKAIQDKDGDAIIAGQLVATQVYDMIYDGTQFRLITVSKASAAEVLAETNTTKYVTPGDAPVKPATAVTEWSQVVNTTTGATYTHVATKTGRFLLEIDLAQSGGGSGSFGYMDVDGVNIPFKDADDGSGLGAKLQYDGTAQLTAGDTYTYKSTIDVYVGQTFSVRVNIGGSINTSGIITLKGNK